MSGKVSDFLSSATSLSAGLWKAVPTAKTFDASISKPDGSTSSFTEKKDTVAISKLGEALQGGAGDVFGKLDDKLKRSLVDFVSNGKISADDLGEALNFALKMTKKPENLEENDYSRTQKQDDYESSLTKMNMIDRQAAKGEISHEEYSKLIRSASAEVQENFSGARLADMSINGPALIDQGKVDSHNKSQSDDKGRQAFLNLQNSGFDIASLMKSISK